MAHLGGPRAEHRTHSNRLLIKTVLGVSKEDERLVCATGAGAGIEACADTSARVTESNGVI